ncbi:MAG: PilZ domain-containing protein [Lachnospiraceae bacterium]|nr:PilZ domain-containing protein [Butyrivibrio sp.]MCM1344328.1 PilZ domain-containing protein [Muribaculaceae bacterium]MCM1409022.1 PilZ domain-containing protein [Lachnospiraceae bacterium]
MIKRLDGGEDRQVTIEVTDVSKSGIGFECKEQLQVGEVYESFLTIWTKEVIHAILRIVRIELKEQMYSYGAVFVGMPDTESARIEVYQTVEDVKKNQ